MPQRRDVINKRSTPIAVSKKQDSNDIRVVINSNPNMVIGRNVALIDKKSKRIFGYGKVTNTNNENAFVDLVTFGDILSGVKFNNSVKAKLGGSKPIAVYRKNLIRRGYKTWLRHNKSVGGSITDETDLLKSTEIISID